MRIILIYPLIKISLRLLIGPTIIYSVLFKCRFRRKIKVSSIVEYRRYSMVPVCDLWRFSAVIADRVSLCRCPIFGQVTLSGCLRCLHWNSRSLIPISPFRSPSVVIDSVLKVTVTFRGWPSLAASSIVMLFSAAESIRSQWLVFCHLQGCWPEKLDSSETSNHNYALVYLFNVSRGNWNKTADVPANNAIAFFVFVFQLV